MYSIITILIAYNQILLAQIKKLLIFIAKNIPLNKPKYDIKSPKYNKLTVDKLPIIKQFEQLDYKTLLVEYKSKHNKELKPVISRGGKPVPEDVVCPHCGAPHEYIYDNTGGRGQLLCKVCKFRFNKDKTDFKSITLTCPYCGHILVKKKDRKHFNIHKSVLTGNVRSISEISNGSLRKKRLNTNRTSTNSSFTTSTGNSPLTTSEWICPRCPKTRPV